MCQTLEMRTEARKDAELTPLHDRLSPATAISSDKTERKVFPIIAIFRICNEPTDMKRYPDIFFDWDDTLYDTQGNSVIALRKLYDERHWEKIMPPFEVFDKAYVDTNVEVWSKYTAGEMDRDTLIVERFRKPVTEMVVERGGDISWITPEACLEMSDRYGDLISRESRTVDGARELVENLIGKGYRLHICSNGFHEVQYRKLRSSGLEKYFSTVVLSEDAGINKPRKEFFDYAFSKTGAVPGGTVMVGDNYATDMAGAMNAGLDTIFFNKWRISLTDGMKKPTFTVDRLMEINDILV